MTPRISKVKIWIKLDGKFMCQEKKENSQKYMISEIQANCYIMANSSFLSEFLQSSHFGENNLWWW